MRENEQVGLTPVVVRQFGIALGIWGYATDVMLDGGGQGRNPELIAIEESDIYGAVMEAIEAQDPAHYAKRQVNGRAVWAEEKPSELYQVMRSAMFEAYRWAKFLPSVAPYSRDVIH